MHHSPPPPRIQAVGRAMPSHYVDQASLTAALAAVWADQPALVRRVADLHRTVGVAGRHFALPLAEYERPMSFGQRNAVWTRVATDLGEAAARDALARAGLEPRDVD